jgi:hypothetical protein
MARTYSVIMAGTSISAAKDLFRLSAASDSILELIRWEVTQDTSETSEQLPWSIYRASTDGTGTSANANPYEVQDAAFGGTCIVNLSADTTKSPSEALWRSAQNIGVGALYHPVPEERIIVPPSGRIAGRLETAPGAAISISMTITFREIG